MPMPCMFFYTKRIIFIKLHLALKKSCFLSITRNIRFKNNYISVKQRLRRTVITETATMIWNLKTN